MKTLIWITTIFIVSAFIFSATVHAANNLVIKLKLDQKTSIQELINN